MFSRKKSVFVVCSAIVALTSPAFAAVVIQTDAGNLSASGVGTCSQVNGQFPVTVGTFDTGAGVPSYGLSVLISPPFTGQNPPPFPTQNIVDQLFGNNTARVISGGIFPTASGTWTGTITPFNGSLFFKNVAVTAAGCTITFNGGVDLIVQ